MVQSNKNVTCNNRGAWVPQPSQRSLKIRYLIRTICCRGLATSTCLHGGNQTSPAHGLFSLSLLVLRLSPPPHRTALCSSGGRGACAAASVLVLPSLPSCGGAFWQGDKVSQFLIGNFHRPVPLQDVYACILMWGHILILSPLSLSLYIFIIFRSVHFILTSLAK